MGDKDDDKKRDDLLKRMLETPPDPKKKDKTGKHEADRRSHHSGDSATRKG